jgi:murein DD-endopeptidase MepM/ murein hydrolase activator NlpD
MTHDNLENNSLAKSIRVRMVKVNTVQKKLVRMAGAIFLSCLAVMPFSSIDAAEKTMADVMAERQHLYETMETLTDIPWHILAAIDQYDRAIGRAKGRKLPMEKLIGIHYTAEQWAGWQNPDQDDRNERSIRFFGGIGRDGDGDGQADRNNDLDVLYTKAQEILRYGTLSDDLRIALWQHYQNPRSVERIMQFAEIYRTFGTVDLRGNVFPLPLHADYSYRDTWGSRRSYGGYRIHEGTDIFAGYGVPVRSTCYGIIEVTGWNRYGGWRVGIRDLNNVYHYYAHLSGYNKNVEPGKVVKPGDIIGFVGSSGYGRPGTQGKFPPHLHYGTYLDKGTVEYSFDPYPFLTRCEREERKRKK